MVTLEKGPESGRGPTSRTRRQVTIVSQSPEKISQGLIKREDTRHTDINTQEGKALGSVSLKSKSGLKKSGLQGAIQQQHRRQRLEDKKPIIQKSY